MAIETSNFFGDTQFWIGKVVSKKAQKLQLSGKGWGWRYKVRIFGTYSENDNVPDEDVHNASVMFGAIVTFSKIAGLYVASSKTGCARRFKPC